MPTQARKEKERQLISQLHDRAMELGYVPRPTELSGGLNDRLRHAFGSTQEAYRAAGFPTYPHGRPKKHLEGQRHPLPQKFLDGHWDEP